MTSMTDFNGIVRELKIQTRTKGRLKGLTFVAKDLFDVAGHVTGAGNLDWARTHAPADENAYAIQSLLDEGALLIGKSCTDELAFSLDGINMHFGIPANPNFPGHIPGGSSSGSASAVASGICDFALGTDTAGSIRVPSAYCGIYGMRPTHGRVEIKGAVPLGHSFDTVGWMARDPKLLADLGRILLNSVNDGVSSDRQKLLRSSLENGPDSSGPQSSLSQREANDLESDPELAATAATLNQSGYEFLLLEDALALLAEPLKIPFVEIFESKIRGLGSNLNSVSLPDFSLEQFSLLFGTLRSFEAWREHGNWLTQCDPDMAPAIKTRFIACQNISADDYAKASSERTSMLAAMDSFLKNRILCLPVICDAPPPNASEEKVLGENRRKNLLLNSIASFAGLPQIVVPFSTPGIFGGVSKFAMSFIAPRGEDELLLRLAQAVCICARR